MDKEPAGRQSNNRWFEIMAELSPVGAYQTDAAGNCCYVNRCWCEIAGLTPEQAKGRGWVQAIHKDDLEMVAAEWSRLVETGQPFHAEYRFVTPHGKITWVIGDARAVHAPSGALEGFIGTITDITRNKDYILGLEQSSERIRTIIEQMPVMLHAFGHKGQVCAWNHEAERVTGYAAAEIIGNPQAMELLFPDEAYRRTMHDAWRETGGYYDNWELNLTAKDGTVKTVAWSNISRRCPVKGWASWGVGVDITKRKQVERDLQERVKELNCLYKVSQLMNRQELDLDHFLRQVVELLPAAWQYPEITVARITFGDRVYTTEKFQRTGGCLSRDIHVRGQKMGTIEVCYLEKRPPCAEGAFLLEERHLIDDIAGHIGIFAERKRAERDKALVAELSAKTEQLEDFSDTISHDLKTPLTAIGGFAQLLDKQLRRGSLDQAMVCVERIIDASTNMEQRLEEIRKLAQAGRPLALLQEVSVKGLIVETLRMMAEQLAERQVKVEVAPDFPRVDGDPLRLRIVIENLLDNALKYLGDQPRPSILVGVRYDGPDAVFFVRDNGIGIDPKDFDTVFELFRRLDKKHPGQGAGLSITRRIVEAHGGRIWVESAGIGHGSCFCFTLGRVADS